MKKLKAILLSGGLGTRAKPFTDYSPKAIIPIHGRPAIDYPARYLSNAHNQNTEMLFYSLC